MSDELTVVGKYDSIVEKTSGWYEVHVMMDGKKYPLRLATKSSNLLDEVRATNRETATFTYKESESEKTNPNTGNPYINRYLEGVVAGATAAAQAASTAGAGGATEKMTKEEWNAKDRRDFRSRSWAQTISAFAHTITADTDPILVFAKLKPFQRKLYEDIVGDLDPVTAAGATTSPAPAAQQQIDEPPPHTDDDIPF